MPDDYRDGLLGPPRPALGLDAIRARRAAISDAPWQIHDIDPTWVADAQNRVLIADDEEGHILRKPDAAFIAAAPADIDALLARVAELEAALDRERARADRNETHGRNLKHETGKLRAELKRCRADADAIRANAGNPDLL